MNLGIYKDISVRTGNDIYIGVVGPVRTGKSTFIKKFMDVLVIPNIENKFKKERAIDELPQSGSGKTIMTCEPKFVPSSAADITLRDGINLKVRLVDCVGYVIDGASGYMDDEEERMVRTPWGDEPMPFRKAAQIGTKKVIENHSTIGILVTTDASIGTIERSSYVEAENRVVNELKELSKPFVVVLNSKNPLSEYAQNLKNELQEKYETQVIVLDVMHMTLEDIEKILKSVLFEFPVKEIEYNLPLWLELLDENDDLRKSIDDFIISNSKQKDTLNDVVSRIKKSSFDDFTFEISNIDLSVGKICININIKKEVYYSLLNEANGVNINSESDIFKVIGELVDIKKEYEKIAYALKEARKSGYGIVSPKFEDYELKEPEMIDKASRHGVKISAKAPALHIICTNVETSISPTIGSKEECEVFYKNIINDYQNDKDKIWESEFFGRNLKNMIKDNMQNKLNSIQEDNKIKIKRTLTRVVNSQRGGIIILWL